MPRRNLPLVVLLASLTISVAAAWIIADSGRERDEARFNNATETTLDRLEGRLSVYVTMLRGARGLFASSTEVSAHDFRTYVRQFDISRTYRGVQGIGFAKRLLPLAKVSLESARRADGISDFGLYPERVTDESVPIVYLEPLDVRNRVALGFNMYSEQTRRVAMDMARDSGRVIATGAVELVQEIDENKQVGFLLYLPLYSGDETPSTVAERRARLRGFIYAPFRADDLFAGIFGSTVPPVAFRVYDGRNEDPARLVYDSHRAELTPDPLDASPAFRSTRTVQMFGRDWTIAFLSLPSVEERSARLLAPAVAVAGLLISLLIAELTRREVIARGRAEQSEKARGRFFAAMSHELRTPLNAIFGYNDLLLAGVHGDLTPPQKEDVERSQRAARHLLELVTDVLDLSKIEAGKVDLAEENVVVPELVDGLFATLRALAEQSGAALHLAVEGGKPTPIVSDSRRIRQILLNLLSNAIKFGGAHPIRVGYRETAQGVVVEVSDQGPGIAECDQQQIFEEFVQLPNAAHGGTGLGLPISKRLAQLLGGTLEVESIVGEGSTFRLTLPERIPEGN